MYFLLFTLVVALLIFPIWTVSVLPWQDYGDHLARIFILAHYWQVPAFQQHYDVKYIPLPNLAMDLIAPPLLRWFDPYTTGKLFASLMIVLFAFGVHSLASASWRRVNYLAIPAAFLVYNALTNSGFVNYMFSIAMMLLAAAAWLRYDAQPSLGYGILATLLAFATYLSHIAGFACLALLIGVSISYRLLRVRRFEFRDLVGFAILIPGLAAYLSLGTEENMMGTVRWASIVEKIKSAWTPFNSYSASVDVLVFVSLIVALLTAWRFGAFECEPRLALCAAAFLLLFIVFPFELRTGNEADARFLVPAFAAGAAALNIRIRPVQVAHSVYAILLVVFSIRIADMTLHWRAADKVSREQHRLIDQVAVNSTVYPLVFLPQDRIGRKTHWQLYHLSGYATVDRDAISGSMLTITGQQPVRRRVSFPFARLTSPHDHVSSFAWPEIFAAYDYIWEYNAPPEFLAFIGQHGDLVARAGLGELYRIRNGRHEMAAQR